MTTSFVMIRMVMTVMVTGGERSVVQRVASQIVVPVRYRTVRRPARGMRAFTSKEAPIDEEEEDSK